MQAVVVRRRLVADRTHHGDELLAGLMTERPQVYFKAMVKLTLVLHRALDKPNSFDRRRNREEVLQRLQRSAENVAR